MIGNVQTFNFVMLMTFFMAILWLVKVFVRIRKLYRLYNALENNLVIRLDGEVNENQHLDAISLAHMQQILNANLMQASSVVHEISPKAHIIAGTVKLDKQMTSKGSVSPEYSLKFTADSETDAVCEVYVGLSVEALRNVCLTQKSPHESKAAQFFGNQELFHRGQYIYKTTTAIPAGSDVKIAADLPAANVESGLKSHSGSYFALLKVGPSKSSKAHASSTFELTVVRAVPQPSSPSGQKIRVDHQIISSRGRFVHLKEVFGEGSDGECLVCLSEPKNTILLPCRHMCICRDCLMKMTTAKCPVCRTIIKRHISIEEIGGISTRASTLGGIKPDTKV